MAQAGEISISWHVTIHIRAPGDKNKPEPPSTLIFLFSPNSSSLLLQLGPRVSHLFIFPTCARDQSLFCLFWFCAHPFILTPDHLRHPCLILPLFFSFFFFFFSPLLPPSLPKSDPFKFSSLGPPQCVCYQISTYFGSLTPPSSFSFPPG